MNALQTPINKLGSQVVQLPMSWATYEQVLQDLGESYAARLAYSHGELEIMSPSFSHANYQILIHDFINILAHAFKLKRRSFGPATLQRADIQTGIEPDLCYYFENQAQIKDCREIDLTQYPAPDLAIEIDITTDSSKKLDICKALGIKEVWLYDAEKIAIYILENQNYQKTNESYIFNKVDICKVLPEFIEASLEDEAVAWDKYMNWAKTVS